MCLHKKQIRASCGSVFFSFSRSTSMLLAEAKFSSTRSKLVLSNTDYFLFSSTTIVLLAQENLWRHEKQICVSCGSKKLFPCRERQLCLSRKQIYAFTRRKYMLLAGAFHAKKNLHIFSPKPRKNLAKNKKPKNF